MTLAAPTVFTDIFNGGSGRTLTWGPFSAAIGDVLVVKAATEDAASTHQLAAPAASSGGVTFTKQEENTVTSHTYGVIYTGKVTTAPTGGQITVTQAATGGSTLRGGVLEQYVGAKVAATPAGANVNGTGAPTGTVTTAANGSIVTSLSGDWAAVDGTSRAYRGTVTEDAYSRDTAGTLATFYFWYQAAATAGSQTIGLTVPIGQTYSMLAMEIQDASGGSTKALAGTLPAAASATGSVSRTRSTAGKLPAASSATAAVVRARGLAGTAAADSATASRLARSRPLGGAMAAAAWAVAAFVRGRALSGSAASSSSAHGSLDVTGANVELAGVLPAASSAHGVLSRLLDLQGRASASAAASGSLRSARALAGVAAAASSAHGTLSGGQDPVELGVTFSRLLVQDNTHDLFGPHPPLP